MNPTRFPVTRTYADSDGESHFEDLYVSMKDAGEIGSLSEETGGATLIFRGNSPDYDFDWHPAPARQFVLMMTGEVEIQVSDGEKRLFRPGDALLIEDLHGKGHKTKNVGGTDRLSVFVQVDAPLDLRKI